MIDDEELTQRIKSIAASVRPTVANPELPRKGLVTKAKSRRLKLNLVAATAVVSIGALGATQLTDLNSTSSTVESAAGGSIQAEREQTWQYEGAIPNHLFDGLTATSGEDLFVVGTPQDFDGGGGLSLAEPNQQQLYRSVSADEWSAISLPLGEDGWVVGIAGLAERIVVATQPLSADRHRFVELHESFDRGETWLELGRLVVEPPAPPTGLGIEGLPPQIPDVGLTLTSDLTVLSVRYDYGQFLEDLPLVREAMEQFEDVHSAEPIVTAGDEGTSAKLLGPGCIAPSLGECDMVSVGLAELGLDDPVQIHLSYLSVQRAPFAQVNPPGRVAGASDGVLISEGANGELWSSKDGFTWDELASFEGDRTGVGKLAGDVYQVGAVAGRQVLQRNETVLPLEDVVGGTSSEVEAVAIATSPDAIAVLARRGNGMAVAVSTDGLDWEVVALSHTAEGSDQALGASHSLNIADGRVRVTAHSDVSGAVDVRFG